MRRREVLTGLLLAGFSTHGEAQGPEKPYRIVILNLTLRADELNEFGPFPHYRAFFQELRRRGFDEKQDLVVVRLSAEGDTNRHSQIVGEAVAIHPDAIFAVGTRFMRLLKEVTTTAPVVGIATDPAGHGLIDSLARPGGNMTGISLDAGVEIVGKRLELLKEIDPRIERVGYLAPQFGWDGLHGEAMERLARTKGITLVGPPLQSPIEAAEYRRVFAAMAEQRAHAVFVSDYAENLGNRHLI
jgi:putative ABC transport system substrate-binding protein